MRLVPCYEERGAFDSVTEGLIGAGLQVAGALSLKTLKRPVLIGPGGKPVVKLFLFAPAEAYDMISQDEATNTMQKFAQLDVFTIASSELPKGRLACGTTFCFLASSLLCYFPSWPLCPFDPAQERVCGIPHTKEARFLADVLPTFRVALLEAGGRPLLSPPNTPHLVLTLQDCVMVEERKIGKLFVDEVVYFLHRAALWSAPPIFYPFVSEEIQSREKVVAVVDSLLRVLDDGAEEAQGGGGGKRREDSCAPGTSDTDPGPVGRDKLAQTCGQGHIHGAAFNRALERGASVLGTPSTAPHQAGERSASAARHLPPERCSTSQVEVFGASRLPVQDSACQPAESSVDGAAVAELEASNPQLATSKPPLGKSNPELESSKAEQTPKDPFRVPPRQLSDVLPSAVGTAADEGSKLEQSPQHVAAMPVPQPTHKYEHSNRVSEQGYRSAWLRRARQSRAAASLEVGVTSLA